MSSERWAQRATCASLLCVTLAVEGAARADDARAAGPSAASPEALTAAKALFTKGLSLLDAGDKERALDYFLRSRALVPGKGNTADAAHCLVELGRLDEALELYEELVTRFADELGAENRRRLVPAMAALRARVAAVVVTANVDGAALIDGRARGRLPLPGPLRVLGGRHVLRVLKDGYATAESTFSVAVGETAHVDVVLRPLAEAGRLRLEDPTNEGADVFVDRVQVGVLPWEGTLAPGDHLVWIAGDRGSGPSRAVVIQGQTATLRLRSSKLGPASTIVVEPPTAELRLDGVPLGAGPWSGRLPVGPHEVAASEPGYVGRTARFEEPEASGPSARITVTLAVDPRHPRWPRRSIGRVRLEVFGGLAAGRGFGSDAEAWCGTPCAHVLGAIAGGRAGFRFPSGLSLDLTGGYVSVGASFTRSRSTTFTSEGASRRVTYDLVDDARIRGPFVGGAAGWAAPLRPNLAVVSRATIGVLFAGSSDPITGRATTASGATSILVTGRGERLGSAIPFVEPELGLEARVNDLHFGLGLGLAVFLGAGPAYGHDLLEVNPAGCSRAQPGAPACAPASALVASERAYRPFAVWVPAVSAGYDL